MTAIRIDIHDENRHVQPDTPWTAAITVGDEITPEEVTKGDTPYSALVELLSRSRDLLENEPAECSDCGHVIQSEGWRQYHDEDGNCHAHRAPR